MTRSHRSLIRLLPLGCIIIALSYVAPPGIKDFITSLWRRSTETVLFKTTDTGSFDSTYATTFTEMFDQADRSSDEDSSTPTNTNSCMNTTSTSISSSTSSSYPLSWTTMASTGGIVATSLSESQPSGNTAVIEPTSFQQTTSSIMNQPPPQTQTSSYEISASFPSSSSSTSLNAPSSSTVYYDPSTTTTSTWIASTTQYTTSTTALAQTTYMSVETTVISTPSSPLAASETSTSLYTDPVTSSPQSTVPETSTELATSSSQSVVTDTSTPLLSTDFAASSVSRTSSTLASGAATTNNSTVASDLSAGSHSSSAGAIAGGVLGGLVGVGGMLFVLLYFLRRRRDNKVDGEFGEKLNGRQSTTSGLDFASPVPLHSSIVGPRTQSNVIERQVDVVRAPTGMLQPPSPNSVPGMAGRGIPPPPAYLAVPSQGLQPRPISIPESVSVYSADEGVEDWSETHGTGAYASQPRPLASYDPELHARYNPSRLSEDSFYHAI
ncbi:hypothetical protein FISHEDRAFT_60003 [Fistulina hepatica ATCC 64428]|uniref:Mid2 domain-containing protein n=1 Tax=Fistulina hepatica ATCC 64428 TaxID=1128425 RepID=A0A0D7A869_9AGAR|nr:hypothetical protein FISHEDRAFT_60003 [Fistulina hepatica ATCC 64428]